MSFGYRTGRKVDGGKRSSLGLCPECGKRGLGKARPSHELSSTTMLRDCRYCGHIHLVGGCAVGSNPSPPPGWYWVKSSDGWEPARLTARGWEIWGASGTAYFSGDDIGEVGERIGCGQSKRTDVVERLLDEYDLRRLDTRDRESVRLALRAAMLAARGQS